MRRLLSLTIFVLITINFTACVNKHGISVKYYSDCDEYYDMQGYYHKECGKDDIITYKEAGEKIEHTRKEIVNKVKNLVGNEVKIEPQPNVW